MAESDFSHPFIIGYGSSPSRRDPAARTPRMNERSPGSRSKSSSACRGLRPRRAGRGLALSPPTVLPSVFDTTSAPRLNETFPARWLAYARPYRRFACVLADAPARLGVDVGRYSFIVSDLHRLLLAGLPAHSKFSLR